MNTKKDEKVDEIMGMVTELLISYVQKTFLGILEKEISVKEAETMISNIGIYILNKNKDIITK